MEINLHNVVEIRRRDVRTMENNGRLFTVQTISIMTEDGSTLNLDLFNRGEEVVKMRTSRKHTISPEARRLRDAEGIKRAGKEAVARLTAPDAQV